MAAMLAPSALPPRGWKCGVAVVATWKRLHSGRRNAVRIFAAKSNERRRKSQSISQGPTFISEEASSSGSGENPTTSLEVNANDVTTDEKFTVAPRNAVLQACTLTSSLLLAGGLVLREASHFASLNGWPVADPMNLSFNFETWHLELIAGLTWPDFRYSSETANRQILTSLETFDYIVVACLPGISEEVLFRGALMPIFGLNWISAFVTGAIFGILHLGNGRKYSFAIWATFVGVAYGLATIASSSIIVPMASHSINNIIGGLIWRFTNNTERE
uniref:CAAX prenyl protease 2/Lysostaphin resistance protein A-like domain-containing protein n=1 Tax=Oryza barthii TaxID=65489 RepID=A0A0D3G5L2_9ORYZ